MTSDVKAMLEARQPGAPSELIFKDRNGKPHKRISNSFNRTVDDLGLNEGITDRRDKVVFHSLRHTFGSWLVQAGLSIFEVKERMRHKDISQTMRYAHLQPDAGKNAVSIIEARKQKAGKVIDFQEATA